MKKIIALLVLLTLAAVVIFWIIKNSNFYNNNQHKLQVTASFYPYYFFASQIGGEKANVSNLTPAGAEPHDYEPSSGDIVKINSSKLLILNGSVEPWGAKIQKELEDKNIKVLVAGQGLFNKKMVDEEGVYSIDPHIWISPSLDKKQVLAILNAFIEVDSINADYYTTNANKLLKELDKLDQKFKVGLKTCQKRTFVTSHSAFSYLADDYNLTQISIAGLSPDAEPSLKQLAEISNLARKNNIKYIFFESLVSPRLSQTIASEIGAQTLVLNPLEGLTPDEAHDHKDYITIMEDNLSNLRIALQCQ